jgi:hypothetical protein
MAKWRLNLKIVIHSVGFLGLYWYLFYGLTNSRSFNFTQKLSIGRKRVGRLVSFKFLLLLISILCVVCDFAILRCDPLCVP